MKLFIPENPHFKCPNKTVNIEERPVNAVHMLNAERVTKSLCLQRWPAFWCESQMLELAGAGLILGQIPHRTEQNSSQMSPGYTREMGGFGLQSNLSVRTPL